MKSNQRAHLVSIVAGLSILLFVFQNCERNGAVSLESQGKMDVKSIDEGIIDPVIAETTTVTPSGTSENAGGLPIVEPTPTPILTTETVVLPVPEVIEKCQNAELSGQMKKLDVSVSFPSLGPSPINNKYFCNWASAAELRDQYYSSLSEQRSEFSIPIGAKICNLNFKFEEQSFKYDDHFVFSFDDNVLASNSMGLISKLDAATPILFGTNTVVAKTFSWPQLHNQRWVDSGAKDAYFYCLGKEGAGSSCQWPITDTLGVINMNYPAELLLQIANQKASNTHQFNFVTTGDNDHATDCQHSPLNFQVEVFYAP